MSRSQTDHKPVKMIHPREPGLMHIKLYAVAEKNSPTHITILEIYSNDEAYKKHIQTPHFLKYKNGTNDMMKSLELVETIPLIEGMKTMINVIRRSPFSSWRKLARPLAGAGDEVKDKQQCPGHLSPHISPSSRQRLLCVS